MRDRAPRYAVVVMLVVAVGCSSPPPPSTTPAVSAVPVSQQGLATVTGKAPQGAVVALEATDAASTPPPAEPVVMDQRGQQFIPAVLIARAGQPVEFRNGEGIVHNVYVTRNAGGAVELNVGTDPGQSHTHTFTAVGTYEVSCDIHPSMRASLAVVNTPFATVSADFGSFVLMNVPPGAYELVTLHGTETTRRPVQVSGPHTVVPVP